MPTEDLLNRNRLTPLAAGDSLLSSELNERISQAFFDIRSVTGVPSVAVSIMNNEGRLIYAKGFAAF